MKLHIACGTVLLQGYENIDLELPGHYLVEDRPDLAIKNITTIDNYYKEDVTKDDFMTGKFHKKEVVCDMFGDVKKLPFEQGTIDEIVGMHIFEHFTFKEGEALLKHWYRLLKPGGSLRVHVPDVRGIMEGWYDNSDETDSITWAIRQL